MSGILIVNLLAVTVTQHRSKLVLSLAALVLCVVVASPTAVVAQPKNAEEWLERISKSARELPYTGVYLHQTPEGSNASRITHLVDKQGNEHEKLEMLDGPLLEVIRRNEEMFCYHPDQKTVRVDKRSTGRFFPSLISGSPGSIIDNYKVKLGTIERVAGHDCQWVVLEPRDSMRYLQKLCAELGTGLLLRAKLFNERNQLLEQFMFTQVDVSGAVSRQDIRSRWEKSAGWQKDYSVKDGLKSADTGWQVGNLPPGFKKVMEMVRNLSGRKEPVAHLVYSDGLSNVSVFVESNGGNVVQTSSKASDDGPISVSIRPVGDFQVTVMGEVPVGAVQAIAESVSRRR